VTNVKEACAWLSYTYLFVRMLRNPLAYGVPWEEVAADPRLETRRKNLIMEAARKLERCSRDLATTPLTRTVYLGFFRTCAGCLHVKMYVMGLRDS
jgi:hypothetical protein